MTKGQRNIRERMRPNIQISHRLNGRVKDLGSKFGLDLNETYLAVILTGVRELESEDELPPELQAEIEERLGKDD